MAASLRSLDVYAPARGAACPATPVVIYFHGGGYVAGDKANQVADKAALFAAEGWVFVSANYRLSPNPPALDDPGRVRYPAAQSDAAAAVAWVRAQASRLRLDPSKVMVMGHSAGGHLVSLISADEQFLRAQGLRRSDLRCTVALDTEAYDVLALVQSGSDELGLYQNAIGTDAATLMAASPIRHVRSGAPAHFVVTRGSAARQAQARDHANALQAAAVPVQFLVASGYAHEEVNAAVGRAGETLITPPLLEFLRSCSR